MIESITTFQLAIKQHGHVHPLLKHTNIRVNLVCDENTFQLILKDGELLIAKYDRTETHSEIEITGDAHAMKMLLEGKERLRALERNGQLKVSAPLRTTLLLESIFYLTKVPNDFVKII